MENSELISKAVEYAKQNATKPEITVPDVATNAGFSIDYFSRIFLAHTGFTVMGYINFCRMKKAAWLLRKTDKSILGIALEAGFDSHEGFIKAFKKIYEATPTEYRNKMKNTVMYLGEITDASVAARFIHENPDFKLCDENDVIDYLLEQDAKRFGYFCTTIKYCGLKIAAPDGNYESGFIGIGDDMNGGYYLEMQTDNYDLLADWLKRFSGNISFYSVCDESYIKTELLKRSVNIELNVTPQALYFGDFMECSLPESIEIRKLTPADSNHILKWAGGKSDSYIKHILNAQDYLDENNLEYGVFKSGDLIAVAGCGIDEVHGLRLNNCCNIRFADGKERDELYRLIFKHVTNDLLANNILPFDDLQHGEYAAAHGCFTSTDYGFEIVNRRVDVIR